MTATYPARTDKAYRGVIYGLNVIDHETGIEVPNDYRGKTRQRGRLRETQHRDRQPFSDRIVGDANVLWEGICTDEELAEMERRFIQDAEVRPRLNVEMNEDNPELIPKWKQVEQRHERDRKLKRPLWVPYEQRTREGLLEWETPDRPAFEQRARTKPPRKPIKRWQKYAIGWLTVWPGTTLAVWVFALLEHWGGWEQTLFGSALFLPSVLLLIRLALEVFATKRTRRKVTRALTGWSW